MDKQYTSKVLKRQPRPRSARLRDTGAGGGSTASMTVIYGGGGSGTSDHEQLTNRDAAGQHPISAITGLQAALDVKAALSHSHAISDVTDLQTSLGGKVSSGTVKEIRVVTSDPSSYETGVLYITLD